ncbi:imm11 family protein [Paenibacillus sp. UNC499MF]|uniref:imm11 family protein n=1 Tax=Paenibacillus sp. UNC499MF TaxID=1502751 RepID=UPI00089FDD43|nr:DUF1629 domain-containing protein [Paenibacillus sp. UNC499MF]SEF83898.1 hypothetical protein SAMN02799616_01173 [Paenibacillus sp. UNC499MF]
MKIWLLGSQFDINIMLTNRNQDNPLYFEDKFEGEIISEWGHIRFNSNKKKLRDSVSFISGIPIFSEKAVSVLQDPLENKTQSLPLYNDDYTVYAQNVINVIDCIDYKKAHVRWVKKIKRPMGFNKYAFDADKVKNAFIFKIPEEVAVNVFVTDEFRNRVLQEELTSFVFTEIWDSEEVPVDEQTVERHYKQILDQIDQEKGIEYPYAQAMRMVLDEDKSIRSREWRVQKNKKGSLIIGELLKDGTYQWIEPVYYPVALRELSWHLVDKLDL